MVLAETLTTTKFVLRLSLRCVNQLKCAILRSIVFEGEIIVLKVVITSLLVVCSLLLVRRIVGNNEIGVATKSIFLVEMGIGHIAENIQLLSSHRSPAIRVEMNIQIFNGRFVLSQ